MQRHMIVAELSLVNTLEKWVPQNVETCIHICPGDDFKQFYYRKYLSNYITRTQFSFQSLVTQ